MILLVIPRIRADLTKILLKLFLLTLPLGCGAGGREGRRAEGGEEKREGRRGERAGEAERTWKEWEGEGKGEEGGEAKRGGGGKPALKSRWGSGGTRSATKSPRHPQVPPTRARPQD